MFPVGLGGRSSAGRADERPARIVTTAGVAIMSDLADRLVALEHRVTELRDFL
jgi:hypothetical protein